MYIECEIVLFADDTSKLFKVKSHQSLYDDGNNTISKVVDWFFVNNLLLNNRKINGKKFTLPNIRQTVTDIAVGNEKLSLADTVVFVGMTLDAKLQWSD